MQGGHAIHGTAPDHGKKGHANLPIANNGHARLALFVTWPLGFDLIRQKTPVNLPHKGKMARQHLPKEVFSPCLQRLRKKRVVGVGKDTTKNAPAFVPS